MIYLDYAATSLKRKEVLNHLLQNIELFEGNASSTHFKGRQAHKALEAARSTIAAAINADPARLIFTSGATEANNMVLDHFGYDADSLIITSNIEHKSILAKLSQVKAQVIYLKANSKGVIDLEDLAAALTKNTKLVSLIYVNNELGSIQDIAAIGAMLAGRNIHFHVDAVQALGHLLIDVKQLNCNSMSFSGHKLGGLNGFGVLYTDATLKPLIFGGNHEQQRRAGTSNVLGAVSMAECLKLTLKPEEQNHILAMKLKFLQLLQTAGIPFKINGDLANQVNHIVNISLPFVKNDLCLTYLDLENIAISAGSACLAGALEPSYVVANVFGANAANHALRFSFGYQTTEADLIKTVEVLGKLYQRKIKESGNGDGK